MRHRASYWKSTNLVWCRKIKRVLLHVYVKSEALSLKICGRSKRTRPIVKWTVHFMRRAALVHLLDPTTRSFRTSNRHIPTSHPYVSNVAHLRNPAASLSDPPYPQGSIGHLVQI
ncbi:hypothetical protein BofuT4_P107240.1 [Botrytis cinerea T4]|uniref:Uncharacterized protein n=1 Tax=Botryotinia fuckeliana (strain T4) TaxID=999810 RepID=G2Y6T8_BOTF4|nr:hypothetical protein BofuT4_P107240.1 [Botrytis cinerea T4]